MATLAGTLAAAIPTYRDAVVEASLRADVAMPPRRSTPASRCCSATRRPGPVSWCRRFRKWSTTPSPPRDGAWCSPGQTASRCPSGSRPPRPTGSPTWPSSTAPMTCSSTSRAAGRRCPPVTPWPPPSTPRRRSCSASASATAFAWGAGPTGCPRRGRRPGGAGRPHRPAVGGHPAGARRRLRVGVVHRGGAVPGRQATFTRGSPGTPRIRWRWTLESPTVESAPAAGHRRRRGRHPPGPRRRPRPRRRRRHHRAARAGDLRRRRRSVP